MQLQRILASLAFFSAITSIHAATFDLVIRNGRVADGTGNPMYFADVGIKDGKIIALGKVAGDAAKEIDARGLVVAPGFIDVHTHAEGIEDSPEAQNFVRMGVTTLVLGNCGGSRLNVGEYFKQLKDVTISPNVCTLIGQGTVRNNVMGGSFMRPASAQEVEKMRALVKQAMLDGAVGMSTGLIYLPGTFTKTDEIIELAKVVGEYDGIYVSHMRNESKGIFNALDELFRIAREGKVRAEVSHIKLSGQSAWGQADKVLEAIEKARAEGLDVTQDQYMYPASSTSISSRLPDWIREGGDKQFLERLKNPETKAKLMEEMRSSLESSGHKSYDYVVVASYRKDKSLNGMNVVEIAKKLRGSDSVDAQIETIIEITKNGGASAVFHSMNEEDLKVYLSHPNTMVASDSGVRAFGEGVPHPRGYGNSARVLARYVRDQKVLRLEDAVRRMTSLPASAFRLKDRGLLREGFAADLVVFDPAKVQDNATFEDPHHYATGFKAVLVNGVPVVESDKHTKARPGQTLRHSGRL